MKKIYIVIPIILIILVVCVKLLKSDNEKVIESIITNAGTLSDKKICWGIKRAPNHARPDVGSQNKKMLEQYGGICLGNENSKKVYLTFDSGYEAGYMEKILAVLKENNVKACFFITAHYLNTHSEMVKRMIDDGHIVGNHAPKFLMAGIEKL